MSKLDSNNMLQIPEMLIEHSSTNSASDISWFVYGNEAFIAETSYREQHKPIYPLCAAKIVGNTIVIPRKVCELLKLDENSNICMYLKYQKITIRKRIFIPEMR